MLAYHDGHEVSTLYHCRSWYTLVTLVYTTPAYGITYLYSQHFVFSDVIDIAVVSGYLPSETVLSYLFCVLGCLSINRNTWKTSAAWMRPCIQMTDVILILGAAVSPQIVKPFLERDLRQTNIGNNITAAAMTVNGGRPAVQDAYLITSALDLTMVVICMTTCAWSSIRSAKELRSWTQCFVAADDEDEIQLLPDGDSENKMEPCSRRGCIVLTLLYVLFVMYGGVDVMMMLLLETYLYEYLGWSVAASTLLVTVCQLTRFIFGTIVVVVSHWVHPTYIVIFNFVVWLTSSVLMMVGLVAGDVYTVIGVIMSSAFACSMYATAITLAEESMNVVAPVMALFVSALGASEVVMGPVAGILLNHVGAVAFPSLLLAMFVIAATTFVLYSVMASESN